MKSGTSGVRLSTRRVHDGRIFTVDIDRVRMPHGREVDMEIIRHPGSVVLVAMTDPDHVVMVRQYRYALDRWIWELPAGSLDGAEAPEQAARRECHEEIGLVPGRIQRLVTFYPTPGYCDEAMHFFRLTDLQQPRVEAAQDEDENIEPRVFSLGEARLLVRSGEIVDLKTAFGLTLA